MQPIDVHELAEDAEKALWSAVLSEPAPETDPDDAVRELPPPMPGFEADEATRAELSRRDHPLHPDAYGDEE